MQVRFARLLGASATNRNDDSSPKACFDPFFSLPEAEDVTSLPVSIWETAEHDWMALVSVSGI